MDTAVERHVGRDWADSRAGFGAACVIALLAARPAHAQEPEQPLEQVVVTGSRIARPDFESASPILSVAADAFEQRSDLSVDGVVSRLPQFTPDMGSTSNNPGNGGQGNVQLRGLGATSTLVLLDGRRLIPANGNGVVDVNVIPPSLIESVEVVTGGASAVYGSDAIAGVVNFKLKDKFDGLRFDGGWGQTDRSDGSEYTGGITGGLGFADGRGKAFGYVGYAKRDAVSQADRKFSEVSLRYFGPGEGSFGPQDAFRPGGSQSITEGRTGNQRSQRVSQQAWDALFASYGYAPGSVSLTSERGTNTVGFNADGSVFSAGNSTPNSVANFRGELDPYLANDRNYSYNFAPWNYLQLPLERISAFGRVSFDAGPDSEVFIQALYADYRAETALAPTPAVGLHLPRSNPYIPSDYGFLLDSRADPSADAIISKRLAELGPRISSTQHDVYQVTLGFHGRVFGDWSYDAYVQVGAHDSTESQTGNALRSKIQELTYAPDGGLSACGGFNLFGPNSISPACAAYISVDATNRSGYDQTVAEVSLNGSMLALPAGDVRLAIGLMYKRDEFHYRADPLGSVVLDDGDVDIQGFNASKDVAGSDDNMDAYVEALVPLLSDVTAVKRLEAGLGYRHSQYASAGGVEAYKAELLYQPATPLRVRSSFQHAVRAPSVRELYDPLLPVSYGADEDDPGGSFIDPCDARSTQRHGPDAARVEALCLAQGFPIAALPGYEDADGEHRGVVGGNPDLGPETADTLTAGFVLQSWSAHPLLSGLRLSIDWYRIDMQHAISQLVATDYVPLCFDARTNPDFSASYALCRLFSRDPTTGAIVGLQDIRQNIVGYKVSGIDTQVDWSASVGPGELGVNLIASWMDEYVVRKVQGLPSTDDVGYVGGFLGASLPEWKWNLTLRYGWGPLDVSAQWRYIDGMRDREESNFIVPGYDYFDVSGSYEFGQGMLDGLILRVGVENLTNEAPPILATPVAANTDPSQYDVLGRRYFVSASYRF
jgi:outer membrane receptor protein involved in Fe transport